ncbi:uncharacterized protein AB675_5608 [Cyphellophora attinorum]|uniref:Voltage-gated hydrogen channel 1 n=1 Tax=Cyphellophora attinorum TaxID=1664694 RepID=A0A0N0NNU6_9EURO|nr:uncharacterized protein AB675_5608 [Phialophora attinorum]KPI41789.1 hypothetical protein AB675_5608 [Phialophora attinorum]
MPPAATNDAPDPEAQPLLSSDRARLPSTSRESDIVDCHISKLHGEDSTVHILRARLRTFFASKWGHYFVIILVSLDITCIFADFLLKLHVCEHTCSGKPDQGFDPKPWDQTEGVLSMLSLLFSSLFIAELVASVFAFGPGRYFLQSRFHVFDAVVIVVAFVVELLLRGPLEEVGGLVVVLRLWRVFKIIEEFSAGAADELEGVEERCKGLEEENEGLRKELEGLRQRYSQMREGNGNGRLNGSA